MKKRGKKNIVTLNSRIILNVFELLRVRVGTTIKFRNTTHCLGKHVGLPLVTIQLILRRMLNLI